MICGHCGTTNADGGTACAACGVAFAKKTVDDPPASPAVSSGPLSLPAKEKAGIGGWLLLFCAVVTFLSPVLTLEHATRAQSQFLMFYDLALAALSIFVGIKVWTVNSRALFWVKVYFLVLLGIGAGNLLLVLSAGGLRGDSYQANYRVGEATSIVFRLVFFVGIWWWYFKASKRVKATFGSNL